MSAGTNRETVPDLCVVGTLAFDDVETPSGRREGVLGGSATYFSVAASSFCRVGLVGVVGEDFPAAHVDLLRRRGVDVSGLEVRRGERTFHWAGRYAGTMDQAETLATDLNVLETFAPRLPEAFRDAPCVFLANIDPTIQLRVLDQLRAPRLVALDTMNLWIRLARPALEQVLERVDGLFINDAEARQLSGRGNLISAGRELLRLGPRFVIVKKGEHGSFFFGRERAFALPSYPVEHVVDPTGAGDSFAGGFIGYLASRNVDRKNDDADIADFARAVIYGSVMGSFCCEQFGVDRFRTLTRDEIEARYEEFQRLTAF
jgi:sugar/nucleoside kinase (ribokinase family)